MNEADIERKVCLYAKEKGVTQYKFNSPARAAVPDRLFIHQGRVIFIEFKATGKKPTEPQKREHDRLRVNGMSVFVVDDVEYGREVIDMFEMGLV